MIHGKHKLVVYQETENYGKYYLNKGKMAKDEEYEAVCYQNINSIFKLNIFRKYDQEINESLVQS